MTKYNWCHNPSCHTIETQSRIRGSGDNKVLRTVKIKVGRYNWANDDTPDIYDYFCNQNCLHQFLRKFCREVANLNPTPKPKETPIKVRTEKYENYRYQYSNGESRQIPYMSTRQIIENSS
tara:strand:+ start:64 stop:426 length:363 start_codon:yes stop_codon:yes gene_type:complete